MEIPFFWLHIKKAGGQSFRRSLSPPYIQTDRSNEGSQPFVSIPKEEWNDALNNYRIPLGEYDYRRMLFAKNFLYSEEEFKAMFKFVIVRNPYDRAVSSWKYLMRHNGADFPNSVNPKYLLPVYSFERFLESIPHFMNTKINRHICMHAAPIWPDITDEGGNLLVDKVIPLENIHQEIDYLNEKFGTQLKSFTHVNRTRDNNDYRKYYNDKNKALVEALYADDVANLGYSF